MARKLVNRARMTLRQAQWLTAVWLFKNWRTYFVLFHHRGPGRQVLETRDGIKIYVRENIWDARIVREIFVEKPYLKGFKNLPSSPTVVDIGGYIGDFSLYAARRMNAARVIVYEPTSENWRMLNDNVALNAAQEQITLVNKAVGKAGTLTLNVEVDGQEVHSSSHWYADAPKREVPSVTLDDVIGANRLERIDLLKVDCEGGGI